MVHHGLMEGETARALLPPGTDDSSRQLSDLSEEIRRTVVDVRRLVEGLRPPALDELGLAGACAQAVERLTAGADVSASVRVSDDLPALPAAVEVAAYRIVVEVAAYRIVVEAVTNTVRHARARHCQVSVHHSEAALAIVVADDGSGMFNSAGHESAGHGHGLAIMRERATELGGTVTVRDGSPGVTVEARLPAVTAPARVSPVPAAAHMNAVPR